MHIFHFTFTAKFLSVAVKLIQLRRAADRDFRLGAKSGNSFGLALLNISVVRQYLRVTLEDLEISTKSNVFGRLLWTE